MSPTVDVALMIAKHRAFLDKEEVEQPLYGISFIAGGEVPLQRFRHMATVLPSSGRILPEMITPEDFLRDVNREILEHQKVGGDLFLEMTPLQGFPWIEAIVGCPIYNSSGTLWAASRSCSWEELEEIDLSENNPWLRKLLQLQSALVENAGGRYPIGTSAMMRGPGDMMGAALGQEKLALALYDTIDKVRSLAAHYTDAWLEVARMQHELTPPFHGGYLLGGWTGLWTPGMGQYLQEDALAYFSPRFYKEVLLRQHRAMAKSAPYTFFHLHPTSLYAVDELVHLENLTIIEVNRELVGPSIEEVLPVLKKIHQHKALWIVWTWGTSHALPVEHEIRCLLEHLSPRGLCLNFCPQDIEEGRVLMRLVEKVYN